MTALMKAADSSNHQFSGTYTTYSLQYVSDPGRAVPTVGNTQFVVRSKELGASDPHMPLLAHRMREYLHVCTHGNGRAYNRENLPDLPSFTDRIRVHSLAVLAADCPWESDDLILQTIRADSSFHGKPWFDCVAVKVVTSPTGSRIVREEVQYAQLLLMFDAQLPNNSGHLEWQPLVYLKWFRKVASKGDAFMSLMMPRGRGSQQDKLHPVLLEEEIVYDAAVHRRQCRCSVMPLSSLIRRAYIVRNYKHHGQFYVSTYKY